MFILYLIIVIFLFYFLQHMSYLIYRNYYFFIDSTRKIIQNNKEKVKSILFNESLNYILIKFMEKWININQWFLIDKLIITSIPIRKKKKKKGNWHIKFRDTRTNSLSKYFQHEHNLIITSLEHMYAISSPVFLFKGDLFILRN